MSKSAPENGSDGSASPESRRWTALRREARAAVAADRERVRKARADQKRRGEQADLNPAIIYVGLLIAALLCGATWIVLDRMRCDPFYAGVSFSSQHSCR